MDYGLNGSLRQPLLRKLRAYYEDEFLSIVNISKGSVIAELLVKQS